MKLLKNIKLASALLSLLMISGGLNAQVCGTYSPNLYTPQNYQELINRKPVALQNHFKQVSSTKVIPVVFHVLFTNATNNISDAQVLEELEALNQDFQQMNPNLPMVDSAFQNIVGNVNVEFRLAKLDPDGECTTGINRVNSSYTTSATEQVKNVVKWDVDKYLNIWVVENIGFPFSALGYSFIPSLAGVNDANAGILILNNQLGTSGTALSDHQSTLTHEVGHYLNLHHIWGTNGLAGDPSNCSADDGISDTPNTYGNINCDQGSSCGSLDNQQNFMDYTDCQIMFTAGQALAMQNALLTHDTGLAPRYNLWQEANLLATGTNEGYDSTIICPPSANFLVRNKVVCLGSQINCDIQELRGPILTRSWESNKNITVVDAFNGVLELNELGYHNISLIVGNLEGNKTITKEATVLVVDGNDLETPIYTEGFANTESIHIIDSTPWLTTSFYNSEWEVINTVSSDQDNKCLGMQTYTGSLSEPDGITWALPKRAELIMPLFDLSNENNDLQLYFDYAYKGLYEITEQTFTIEVSKDCGENWTLVYEKDDFGLLGQNEYFATAPLDTSYNPNPWIPTSSQWKKLTIPMDNFAGESVVMMRIRTSGIDGHYLYIDNFEFTSSPLSVDEENGVGSWLTSAPGQISINPKLNLDEIKSISIFDVQGKLVMFNASLNNYEINHRLPEGIYLIQVKLAGNSQIKNKKMWLK